MEAGVGSLLPTRKLDVRDTCQSFFNWDEFPLFDDQDPWYERDSTAVRGVRVNLKDSDGKGYWEVAQLSEQLLLRINNASYHTDYQVPNSVLGVDLVTIRFIVLGEITSLIDKEKKRIYSHQSVSITLNPSGDKLKHQIIAGQKLISISLFFSREELIKLLGSSLEGISISLKECLIGEFEHNKLFKTEMTPAMMNAVIDLACMDYTGKMRYMYTQAKVHELICLLFQQFQVQHQAKINLRADDAERLQKAQKLMLENISKPLSIDILAKRVGVNRTKLEIGFKQLFGSTVYDFYHRHRMQKAKRLLEDSRHSIAQVAEAMGYEHPGNFTAAFKKFYGVVPKYIKRHGLIQN